MWSPFDGGHDFKIDPIWRPLNSIFLRAICSDQRRYSSIVRPNADFVAAITDWIKLGFDIGTQWIISDGNSMPNLTTSKSDFFAHLLTLIVEVEFPIVGNNAWVMNFVTVKITFLLYGKSILLLTFPDAIISRAKNWFHAFCPRAIRRIRPS